MNNRDQQKRLKCFIYDLLTKTPYTPEHPIDQKDLFKECLDAGFDVTYNESQNQHGDHCRWLTKIVDELGCDPAFDKIPWHHGYKYFVCDRAEAEQLLDLREQRIALASVRIGRLRRKIKRDRAGKLVTNTATPMPKKGVKRFHDTFIRKTQHNRTCVNKAKFNPETDLWQQGGKGDVPLEQRLNAYWRKKPGVKGVIEITLSWLDKGEQQ